VDTPMPKPHPPAPRKKRSLVARWKDWLFRPTFDWVQVEINTDCDSACVYCPRTVLGKAWPQRRMSMETFVSILPGKAPFDVERAPTLIHLQGWGEPFRHPNFLDMVAHAKRGGYRVSTTTNGNLLDAALAERLVKAGIDTLAFSLAGVDARNDNIRRGTRLVQVMDAIATVDRIKRRLGVNRPAVNVAYMLLKSNLDTIERMPGFFGGTAIAEVVVSTLGLVASPGLGDEAIVAADDEEFRALRDRCDSAAKEAVGQGFSLHFQLPRPHPRIGLCSENVLRSLVVSADGLVTPCVLSRFPPEPDDGSYRDPFVFGDLATEGLREIWWRRSYRYFRRSHRDAKPPDRCRSCIKLGL
jgi:MoaA/NifB/PqqE/SkfB family radical SAM enzyme